MGSWVASTWPAVDGLARLNIHGGHLSRTGEVEIGLTVGSEVPGQRHRLRHRAESCDAGPVRDGCRSTTREEKAPTPAAISTTMMPMMEGLLSKRRLTMHNSQKTSDRDQPR